MRRHSGFGWLELTTGILLVVLGIWAFVNPGRALTGMVFAYGIAAIVMGIVDILLYIKVERYTGFGPMISLISGILSVMSGMVLLVYPSAAAIALTLLFPLWFIAHCISKLSQVRYIRYMVGETEYYITFVINVIGLILGCLMLFSPIFTLKAIRYFACAYLILLGIDSVVMAVSRMGMRG